ncbi:hypothetical protein [Persicobacter sp. CCB-QB2]|uniref:hypothetical protein n=1 Tax=Persicobacter sp. CCB-QB2 TaxID=1561025 RepID=UPI0006A9E48A|nr:hypothetical protein [Persicobacter sp. CCB-QB2]
MPKFYLFPACKAPTTIITTLVIFFIPLWLFGAQLEVESGFYADGIKIGLAFSPPGGHLEKTWKACAETINGGWSNEVLFGGRSADFGGNTSTLGINITSESGDIDVTKVYVWKGRSWVIFPQAMIFENPEIWYKGELVSGRLINSRQLYFDLELDTSAVIEWRGIHDALGGPFGAHHEMEFLFLRNHYEVLDGNRFRYFWLQEWENVFSNDSRLILQHFGRHTDFYFREALAKSEERVFDLAFVKHGDTLSLPDFSIIRDEKRPLVREVVCLDEHLLLVKFSEPIQLPAHFSAFALKENTVLHIEKERSDQLLVKFQNAFPSEDPQVLEIRNIRDLAGNTLYGTKKVDFVFDFLPPNLIQLNWIQQDSVHLVFHEAVTEFKVEGKSLIFPEYPSMVGMEVGPDSRISYLAVDGKGNQRVQTIDLQPSVYGAFHFLSSSRGIVPIFEDTSEVNIQTIPPFQSIRKDEGELVLDFNTPFTSGDSIHIFYGADLEFVHIFEEGVKEVVRKDLGLVELVFDKAVQAKGEYYANGMLVKKLLFNLEQDALSLLLEDEFWLKDSLYFRFENEKTVSGFLLPSFERTLYMDQTPPEVDSLYWQNSNSFTIAFTESIEDPTDLMESFVIADQPATGWEWQENTLTIHIKEEVIQDSLTLILPPFSDLNGNLLTIGEMVIPAPIRIAKHAVLINEVMADPLDGPEFVELYNASDQEVPLHFMSLEDDRGRMNLPYGFLAPHHYYLLDDLMGISLNNTEDRLSLSSNGIDIHKMWYEEALFGLEKGHSLELVDQDMACKVVGNWKNSDAEGGSPGEENSQKGKLVEGSVLPKIVKIWAWERFIQVFFNQEIDSVSIEWPKNMMLASTFKGPHFWRFDFEEELAPGQKLLLIQRYLSACDFEDSNPRELYVQLAKPPEAGDIQVNEVLFDPYPEMEDFIELKNFRNCPLVLHDCYWRNESSALLSEDPLILEAGEVLALTEDSSALHSVYPSMEKENVFVVNALPSLPNDGASFRLENNAGVLLDECIIDAGSHHPILNEVEGVSLLRVGRDGLNKSAWVSCSEQVGFASPGLDHGGWEKTGTSVEVEAVPELLEVGSQWGRNEMRIRLKSAQLPSKADIAVFDFYGRKVIDLASNYVLAPDNEFVWYGQQENGNFLPAGHYLIWVEVTAAEQKSSVTKLTVAIVYE